MTEPVPTPQPVVRRSTDVIRMEVDLLRDQREAKTKELDAANRNANIGGILALLGFALFWMTNWYIAAIFLFLLGVMMYLGGASGRGRLKKETAELENKITALTREATG